VWRTISGAGLLVSFLPASVEMEPRVSGKYTKLEARGSRRIGNHQRSMECPPPPYSPVARATYSLFLKSPVASLPSLPG
jgi:hypothetical protein